MKLEIEIAGRVRVVDFTPGETTTSVDGLVIPLESRLLRPGVLSLLVDGRAWRVVLEEGASGPAILVAGERIPYSVNDPRSLKTRRAHAAGEDGPRSIKASMPGRVVRVLVKPGDAVEAHEGIVVIEAMKMQNELKSPKQGKIAEIRVKPGDTVAAGDVLAIVE